MYPDDAHILEIKISLWVIFYGISQNLHSKEQKSMLHPAEEPLTLMKIWQ